MSAIDDAIRALHDAVTALDMTVREQCRDAAHLPRTTADIEAAIEEWLASDEDASAHFDRFPGTLEVPHKETAPDVQADWSRCCERTLAARDRLTAVAKALREARAAKCPEPACDGRAGHDGDHHAGPFFTEGDKA